MILDLFQNLIPHCRTSMLVNGAELGLIFKVNIGQLFLQMG